MDTVVTVPHCKAVTPQLIDALGLSGRQMACFIGAGGKTSLMQWLAMVYAGQGRSVLVTTSTKMFVRQLEGISEPIMEPEGQALCAKLRKALTEKSTLTAAAGLTVGDKVSGLNPACLDLIFRKNLLDAVLVEADGARGRSFKAPAEHEPVLPSLSTLVVALIGVDILGACLSEQAVHRPDIVSRITGLAMGQAITEEVVATVMTRYRHLAAQSAPNARFIPVINKADTAELRTSARHLARCLLSDRIDTVLVTSTRDPSALIEVVTA